MLKQIEHITSDAAKWHKSIKQGNRILSNFKIREDKTKLSNMPGSPYGGDER